MYIIYSIGNTPNNFVLLEALMTRSLLFCCFLLLASMFAFSTNANAQFYGPSPNYYAGHYGTPVPHIHRQPPAYGPRFYTHSGPPRMAQQGYYAQPHFDAPRSDPLYGRPQMQQSRPLSPRERDCAAGVMSRARSARAQGFSSPAFVNICNSTNLLATCACPD